MAGELSFEINVHLLNHVQILCRGPWCLCIFSQLQLLECFSSWPPSSVMSIESQRDLWDLKTDAKEQIKRKRLEKRQWCDWCKGSNILLHNIYSLESACNAEDPGLIPRLWISAGEGIGYPIQYSWASLVAQLVKNPPARRETWIQSLGWEDPLEQGLATHSSILAWKFHGLYSPWG